mgnify:CR=1 FL=1
MALLMIDGIVRGLSDAITEDKPPDLDSIMRTAAVGAMMRVELLVFSFDPDGGAFVANFRSAMPPVIRGLQYEFMKDRRDIPDDKRLLRKIIDYQEHVKRRVVEAANAGFYLIGNDRILRVADNITDDIHAAWERCT